MRSEGNVLNDCMVALSVAGCTVWRNNTGALPDRTGSGRVVKFGLCKGGSDIIGMTSDGRFLAVECKTAIGRATPDQVRFIDAVNRMGGRAGIARSAKEAVDIAGMARY
jgi:hypothetical protein